MIYGSRLIELFALLERPAPQGDALVLKASLVPGRPRMRIAKDSRARPALLISVDELTDEASPFIELTNFSYRSRTACLVDHDGITEQQTLAVLLCRAEDPGLQEWFLRTVGAIIGELAERMTQRELDLAVERLVQLFLALGRPSSSSIQGLWGELVLIAYSPDPTLLLTAWHADPMEPYDFVAGLARLEVKTARGSRREHHYSLDQLLCPEEVRLAVASILVQPSPAGVTVGNLVDFIESRVAENPGVIAKLHEVVALTLGSDWHRAADHRFSVRPALESVVLFDGRQIPRVSPDLPPEVSDVRFKVEMWDLPVLDPLVVAEMGLWLAASPSMQINLEQAHGGSEPSASRKASVP